MSSALESRAAVFTDQPQAIEVYQAGAWWAGELLGWRHGTDGSCEMWVRVTLGGVEETAWMDLTGLRLPERHPAVAPASAGDLSSTQKLPRASSATRREPPAPAQADATASMPAVRDLSVVPSGPRSGGRRRAPEGFETVAAPEVPRSGGRRRAPDGPRTVSGDAPSPPRSGGRRRAPEVAEPEAPVEDFPASSAAGRHRAALAADAGRHRKADTGTIPAIQESAPATTVTAAAPPATRLDDTAGGRPRSAWAGLGKPQPEQLTRPMRLSDQVPHARRPRLDGSLSGV